MQMIGKNYIPADGDSKINVSFVREINKGGMDIQAGKQSSSPTGATRDEVERVSSINPIKSPRGPGELWHAGL